MAAKLSHPYQWQADEKYLALEQTNVRMSGNIKCIITEDERTGFESIDSTSDLTSLEYKGFEANVSQGYLMNLQIFANKLKKLNQLYSVINMQPSTTKFSEQLNTIYNYGAYRQQNDMFNKGGIRFFAPLFTYGDLPERFIIIRMASNSFEHKNLATSGDIIASYDLRKGTKIGDYLRTLTENEQFRKACFETDLETGFGWHGINPYSGYLHTAYEHNIESYLANERTLLEQDNAMTNGWMRNNLICANILNLEFCFSDINAKYGFNTYIGLYINEAEYDEMVRYSASTLIVSENSTDIRRYVQPTNPDQSTWNTNNYELPPSIEPIGSTEHIIDTEFDISDPIAWIRFTTMPVKDTRITVTQNNTVLFDYMITNTDIKATMQQTLSSIVNGISNSDLNLIGLYAEYYEDNLILYFPTYEKGRNEFVIKAPKNAIINTAKFSGDQIYMPYVRDAYVKRFANGADSFVVNGVEYAINDAYQLYTGDWYVKSDAPESVLDAHTLLVYYKHFPSQLKIFVPITFARFQQELEDPHNLSNANNPENLKQWFVDTLWENHFWNEAVYQNWNHKPTFKELSTNANNPTLIGIGNMESLAAIIDLTNISNKTSGQVFVNDLDQSSGNIETFSNNPYNRFNEKEAVQSKLLNKEFPFIARMGNPFGTDAMMLPYYSNISLQYNINNFVPIKHTFRNPATLTHNWFLIEGIGKSNSLEQLQYYTPANPILNTRELKPEVVYVGGWFFEENGQFFVFDPNGSYSTTTQKYHYREANEDISSYRLCYLDKEKELAYAILNIDYKATFSSIEHDAYDSMVHEVKVDSNVIEVGNLSTTSLIYKEHSWVEMQLMKGWDTLYSAFFMGVEYTFEGNYDGYRFAVLLVSSYSSQLPFELIDNSVFKTLTLLIYQNIPSPLITTLNHKVPFNMSRLLLYYANQTYIGVNDLSTELDTGYTSETSVLFADMFKPKTLNGIERKIALSDNSPLYQYFGQNFELNPFFTIQENGYLLKKQNDQIVRIPTQNVPLFCVIPKDISKTKNFTTYISPNTSFSWFFVMDITDDTGFTHTYTTIKVTAQRIHEVYATHFWCEDITLEIFPNGTPSVEGSSSPLYQLIIEGRVNDHAFYNELVKINNIEQCVPYIGMFEVSPSEATSVETVYVRSLKNEYWLHIGDEIDLNDQTNSWMQPFISTINGHKYFTFNPNRLASQTFIDETKNMSLFERNNLWYMTNKLSGTHALTTAVKSQSFNKQYEALSFSSMMSALTSSPISCERISKMLVNEVETKFVQTFSKYIKISENPLSMIISSLVWDGTKIQRGNYLNFPIQRYKFDYAPIFERLGLTCENGNDKIFSVVNSRKKYIKAISLYNDNYQEIFDDLTLDIDGTPYYSEWDGVIYKLPFAISPTGIQNLVSRVFSYSPTFEISVKVENGKANIINALYDVISSKVFTLAMSTSLEIMSAEEITAASMPDYKDILPSNVHMYDHKLLAFKRFYRDLFTKQYKCVKLVTPSGEQLDFMLDNETLIMVTNYSGLVNLVFEQQ